MRQDWDREVQAMRRWFAVTAIVAGGVAAPAGAQRGTQWAAAVEYRTQVGTLDTSADRRAGLALRAMVEGRWRRHVSWRLEGAYTQVQYDRNDPGGKTPITESGFETAGFVRGEIPTLSRWRVYGLGGLVASLRASCGIDNAFTAATVDCGSGSEFLLGWGAGAGVRMMNGLAGWDLFAETRLLDKVTSAGGGKLITLAIGAAF
jgi:hypothetical protein